MKRVIFYRILINVFWQTQNAVEGRSRVFLNVHHRISDKRGTLKRKEDVLYLKPGGFKARAFWQIYYTCTSREEEIYFSWYTCTLIVCDAISPCNRH